MRGLRYISMWLRGVINPNILFYGLHFLFPENAFVYLAAGRIL
ncbi:protein of unknown function [Paraburkholderia dioscoreae]|uniref:Uncharacterized protein n=1 Tax=Paraburkholderia dioscoreae TaxID=2604047 RepID=A0A5Q4Z3E4_9BURK|nr:protein of unknown function [Paraburkholderia dioscoreae]